MAACIAIWPSCAPANGTCERNVFRAMGLDYRYLTPVTMCWPWSTRCRNCAISIIPSCCISPPPGQGLLSRPRATRALAPRVRFDMATGRKLCLGHPSEFRAAHLCPILQARRSAPPSKARFAGCRYHGCHALYHGLLHLSFALVAGKQFVDVGIAEEHAVTFALPRLRASGAKASLCYCTARFLQRDETVATCGLNDVPQPSWYLARQSLAPRPRRTFRSLIFPCWAVFPTCTTWRRPAWRNICPC